ncbi:unnamed protein product [Lymnaea stagnalis]|uniref:BTB domain-containing protein n=1 Tax=Lymnaea stagnalis TaxID=6523 RepID=A0AAV2HIJ6_LYMST
MQAGDEEDGLWFHYQKDFGQLSKSSVKHYEPSNAGTALPGTSRALTRDFTHLRRAGDFSDAIIRVGNVTFPVHRNILSCCSPYFRALFTIMDGQTRPQGDNSSSATLVGKNSAIETNMNSSHIPLDPDGGEFMDFNQSQGDMSWAATSTPLLPESNKDLSAVSQSLHQPSSPTTTSCLPKLVVDCSISGPCYTPQQQSPHSPDRLRTPPQSTPPTVHGESQRTALPSYEVTISDVSPETMNDIIEHAYGGKVVVSAHNVEQLLPAADRFQVTSLLKECCDFLSEELSIGNCISIVKFASHFYQCEALRQLGTQFLLDNFTSVFQTSPEFEKLTCKELCFILKADQLNAKHEELVLDAVIRWVIADVDERQKYIPELVSCARVGLMLPDNMGEFVDSWLLSRNLSSDFSKVTIQVMESVLQLQKQQMAEVDSAMFSPRLPRDIMFVIGGSNFGFPLNLVEAFDCRTWLWSIICPYDFAPRSYHGMVSLDNEIYIIGGFSGQVYLSSCCKLKPDTLTWEDVTPMNTKRCYVGVAELQGCIYAVGGYDGVYRLNSAERFNKKNNQWSFISPMIQQRSDAGVAVLDDKIYVCGGFNGMECIRAVEMYDLATDQWSPEPSMPRGRSGLGLVGYCGRLYAVGGFDGTDSTVRLSTMECYSPVTRQWTRLEPMPHPRSNLAVEVLEDVLYAIGGYSGDRTTSAVECYDFTSNSWYQSTRLSHNRSALGVCVVSGLPNTAEILRRDPTGLRPPLALREY